MTHSWLWHLFHDPMRDNPWALLALLIIGAGMICYVWIRR